MRDSNFKSVLTAFPIAVAIMTVLCCSTAIAQSYKGPKLFGLNGPVKQYACRSESKISSRKVNFTRNGLIKGRGYDYDQDGYPTGYSFMYTFRSQLQGTELSLIWGKDSLLQTAEMKFVFMEDKTNSKFELIYEDAISFPTRVFWVTQENDRERKVTFDYFDYKFDDFGNWISRGVIRTCIIDGTPEKNRTYTETAKYKYYK